ncbi:MAG: methyltransferase domain-containing protein [Pseudonocardiaceae bacterium]
MTGEGYAPGWTGDALAMMAQRTADVRAAFVFPFLADGLRVLDVGCGPGTITLGLAEAVAPTGFVLGIDIQRSQVELATETATAAGAENLWFEQGSGYDLPVPSGSVDVAFAHALFEHLGRPADALAELRRVLRPGGVLAVSSSDWSGAVLNPRTPDVDDALHGHYLLRRQAGGDPFAGGRLETLVREAGFSEVRATENGRVDMTYPEIARYVGGRVTTALADADATERPELQRASEAARRWAEQDGDFLQRWVEVTARSVFGVDRTDRSVPAQRAV